MSARRHNRLQQRGTTLVEVLVAAIIIGIGLLGIASLQVKSMQASTNAELRARATDLAWALADRMRTNLQADNDYITGTLSSCPVSNTICSMTPGGSPISKTNSCSPTEIALADLEEIYCATDSGVNKVLPGGTLDISCTDNDPADTDSCSPGSDVVITVTWTVRDDVFGSGTDRVIMPVIPGAP